VTEEESQEVVDTPIPVKSQLASIFNIRQIETIRPVDPNFSIVIPKIAANARIIDNVNPADESEYLEKLKFGVAHAAGTYLPGQNGHIFLFAHSTDYVWNISTYNAVFYLLYKLDAGDEVDVFFEGRRHVYVVTDKKVVDPTDVQYLTNKTESEALTLQTCWPPGTTLKRLLVFAKPKVSN
jgi:sortase A